ncbi:MAG TPA: hypothetical protein DDY20_02500 [Desulfobulbaceae bacterium]|nr:hypothetical protein [Desulfobulbaceae bacterium]
MSKVLQFLLPVTATSACLDTLPQCSIFLRRNVSFNGDREFAYACYNPKTGQTDKGIGEEYDGREQASSLPCVRMK